VERHSHIIDERHERHHARFRETGYGADAQFVAGIWTAVDVRAGRGGAGAGGSIEGDVDCRDGEEDPDYECLLECGRSFGRGRVGLLEIGGRMMSSGIFC
jgi:hypothetical protein